MKNMSIVMISLLALGVCSSADNSLDFNSMKRVYTTHVLCKNDDIDIKRNKSSKCNNIGISPENVFGKNKKNIDKECKKSFITSFGKIQPMKIFDDVQTVGELEVITFIELVQKKPKEYLLIDSRKINWYEKGTIPSAAHLSYDEIVYDETFPEDFQRVLKLLNIQKAKESYDFSKAKTLLLFCNANWCAQSSWAIEQLIKLGYPQSKLLWYRGGTQDWMMAGYPVIKP
jgi:rhodanese-related sulfurtransferase